MIGGLRGRDFLREADFSAAELDALISLAARLKADRAAGVERQRLAGRVIALVFEKTSTRTRCAFEVAAYHQGAHVTFLDPAASQLGHKESAWDTGGGAGRDVRRDPVPRIRRRPRSRSSRPPPTSRSTTG